MLLTSSNAEQGFGLVQVQGGGVLHKVGQELLTAVTVTPVVLKPLIVTVCHRRDFYRIWGDT